MKHRFALGAAAVALAVVSAATPASAANDSLTYDGTRFNKAISTALHVGDTLTITSSVSRTFGFKAVPGVIQQSQTGTSASFSPTIAGTWQVTVNDVPLAVAIVQP